MVRLFCYVLNNVIGTRLFLPVLYFLVKQQLKPIVRTIENDLEIIDDPMGEEYEHSTAILANRRASLQLKIVTHNNDQRYK